MLAAAVVGQIRGRDTLPVLVVLVAAVMALGLLIMWVWLALLIRVVAVVGVQITARVTAAQMAVQA